MIDKRILKVKLRQNAFLGVVVVALLGLILVVMFGGKPPPPPIAADIKDKIKLTDMAGGQKGDKALWVGNDAKFSAINKRLEGLEKDLDTKNQRISELEKREKDQEAEKSKLTDDFKKTLDKEINHSKELEGKLQNVSFTAGARNVPNGAPHSGGPVYPNGDPFLPGAAKTPAAGSRVEEGGGTHIAETGGVVLEKISLSNTRDEKLKTHDVENYIPAGAYAEAKVIEGVDASVGLKAPEKPLPVLLRVMGPARSAATTTNGAVQETDISGCAITAEAFGDLSSEKVYARLLKMTCSREDGKVFETPVKGYIGALGKTGVRGHVVSREGDFITQAFVAGMVGGIGQGLAYSTQNIGVSPLGVTTTPSTELSNIATSGLGMGASKAGSKIEDYLIKRAEQYQPVVQLNGGTNVEIVFEDGVRIDGKKDTK